MLISFPADAVAFSRVGNRSVYFQCAGQGNPPVLFVHGFGCELSDWLAQRQSGGRCL